MRTPPGAMQFDVAYVEWPADDKKLGAELWNHIDETAVGQDPEVRRQLRENGFKVGIVGSNPPLVLQRMIGMKSDFAMEPNAEQSKQLASRSFMLLSGGETEVQASNPYPSCTIALKHGDEVDERTFLNAVCKYRIKAVRTHEGWAKLEFMPRIYHGDEALRYEVGENGWTSQNGQLCETFRSQRFAVELKVGDMAIITVDEKGDGTMANLFFRGTAALRQGNNQTGEVSISSPGALPEPEFPIQRLLLVRLSGVDHLDQRTIVAH